MPGRLNTTLQRATVAACAANALLLALLAFFPTHPPLVLTIVFAGVWIFGAAMLLRAPLFGAIGTTAYGVLLGVDVLRMHGMGALDIIVSVASLAGAALAAAFAATLRRGRTVMA